MVIFKFVLELLSSFDSGYLKTLLLNKTIFKKVSYQQIQIIIS